MLCFI